MAEKAASVLMQVVYVARYARFGWLCMSAKLALRTPTQDDACEKAIFRLMRCIMSLRQVG